jgi:hypothetical protein
MANQYPIALYDIDHATPSLTPELAPEDAGVLAVAYGTVTHITTDPRWTVTLTCEDATTITATWHTAPKSAPAVGEQILVVGIVRPQADGTIILTALRDPVLTGRRHPTQSAVRPEPQPEPEPAEESVDPAPTATAPAPAPAPQPEPECEWTSKDPNPLCDEIVDLLNTEHDREPWGVTYHRIKGYAVVVNTHPGQEDIRETFLRPWRRTLRKAGYHVQTRFDLNGTRDRQIGPTLEARYLLITPSTGTNDSADDRPDDYGPSAFTDERAADMRMWPLAHYRAMRDLRL